MKRLIFKNMMSRLHIPHRAKLGVGVVLVSLMILIPFQNCAPMGKAENPDNSSSCTTCGASGPLIITAVSPVSAAVIPTTSANQQINIDFKIVPAANVTMVKVTNETNSATTTANTGNFVKLASDTWRLRIAIDSTVAGADNIINVEATDLTATPTKSNLRFTVKGQLPQPTATCPISSNSNPVINSVKYNGNPITTLSIKMGMDEMTGSETKLVTIDATTGDTPSTIETLSFGNNNVSFSMNAGITRMGNASISNGSGVGTGSVSLAIDDQNAECGALNTSPTTPLGSTGSASFSVRDEFATNPTGLCDGLRKTASTSITLDIQNACLPIHYSAPTASSSFTYFGSQVATDGDWAVVSSPQDDPSGAQNGGVGYVFHYSASANWDLAWGNATALPTPTGLRAGDQLTGVAIKFPYLALGTMPQSTSNDGSVFIYKYGSSWVHIKTLQMTIADYTKFGMKVALGSVSGTLKVAVAATEEDNGNGAVYVFDLADSGSASFQGTQTNGTRLAAPASAVSRGSFGTGLAISGSTLVVSSPNTRSSGCSAKVYFYGLTSLGSAPTMLSPDASLALDSAGSDCTGFGRDLAISGNLMVVGAPNAGGGAHNAGAAVLYPFPVSGTGTKLAVTGYSQAFTPTAGDLFGGSVAISQGSGKYYIGVGAPQNGAGTASTGYEFLFTTANGSAIDAKPYRVRARFDLRGNGNAFGNSSALGTAGGNPFLLIGAPSRTSNTVQQTGAAYFYDVSSR